VTLAVVEVSPGPVIKQGDPGTEGNKFGLEGGCVFKHEGLYHLFTSEMMADPYAAKMRLGHWTSPDRMKWTRSDPMVESSGDQTGTDLKAAVWAPMPFYDEASKRWNMYYVAYRSKPNDDGGWYVNYDGRIIRAISQTPGPAGLKGPWKDAGIALEPDWEPWKEKRSQPWEGLQGTDSMSPPYAVGGKWLAFYGSAQTQNRGKNPAYKMWSVGLAEASAPTGPWKRRAEGNPMPFGDFAENPIVSRLPDGSYLMVCDAGVVGYAWSADGLNWSRAQKIQIPKTMSVWWDGGTRTPLGCNAEADGSYTIFFMAHRKGVSWQELGFIRATVEKKITTEKGTP
jgi:hypothetical protein